MTHTPPGNSYDVLCLSHLRWNFVFQRPQHLLTRCARERRVFFFEEPIFDAGNGPELRLHRDGNVIIATPHLPAGTNERASIAAQRQLLDQLIIDRQLTTYVVWYYTPMALAFSDHLGPACVVFDCMDELAAFANAPAGLKDAEAALLRRADVVFTGGQSLYEAKRDRHPNVHPFPSSVEIGHFAQARSRQPEPDDQGGIPSPRLGFFGVIDERMDLALLEGVARARPDWHLVLLGPIVKIDPAVLPQGPNIHYLGPKPYAELPRYIASWDIALLPFARNDSTRFISPTKTPEYLAAGRPVVSTSIRDVVRPYGQQGLVRIADTIEPFVAACTAAMAEDATERTRAADAFLRQTSWDGTWAQMRRLVDEARSDAASAAAQVAAAGAE
jgi:glycosyltransferase involved in cell wall biosynthesis